MTRILPKPKTFISCREVPLQLPERVDCIFPIFLEVRSLLMILQLLARMLLSGRAVAASFVDSGDRP
jgi:hypothetical protein